MSFSEATKLEVRRKSHFHCCLCKSPGVEIHHVIPQAEGGEDTEENAAPLCPSCHETYGANPSKRKLIREARDLWYEICSNRYSGDPGAIEQIRSRLDELATKEEVEHIVLKNLSNPAGQAGGLPWQHLKYSLERDDFVHPLIVRELIGWLSDRGHSITTVDIGLANRSNRFHGDFSVQRRDERDWVTWHSSEQESFSYSLIGVSPSGIQIVESYDSGGGTGVFGYVCFLCFELDRCLNNASSQNLEVRNRLVLKILGSIGLGDRYEGTIQYKEGLLMVGPDIGWFSRGDDACFQLPIE